MFLTQKCYFSAPKNLQAVLSEREAEGVRAKVQELEPKVMEFLGTGDAKRWIERRGSNRAISSTSGRAAAAPSVPSTLSSAFWRWH